MIPSEIMNSSSRSRRITLTALLSLGGLAGLASAGASTVPRRLMVLVLDQFRADFLKRTDLPNIARLQATGTTFVEAIVGHLASETIVGHPVIASGRLPRSLPWGDEVMRDVEGVLGTKGEIYLTSGFTLPQMRSLLCGDEASAGSRPATLAELASGLGGRSFAIGQKDYAAGSFGPCGGGPVITFSDKIADGEWKGWVKPAGEGVPAYLTEPVGNRFHLDARETYGTADFEYPQKGNMYLPGSDPAHAGGDLWVADVAREVMEREADWRVMLVTMGGIDRVGHMLGEYEGPVDRGQAADIHLENVLHTADQAVGKLLELLEKKEWLAETMIVLTSDHGAQSGQMVGDPGKGRAYDNWYWGKAVGEEYLKPSKVFTPLTTRPDVRFIVSDSMIRIWVTDPSAGVSDDLVKLVAELPGVFEVHRRRGLEFHRALHRDGVENEAEARWSARVLPQLLDSLAAPHGPDLVGLLTSRVTYGAPGDHGGHQETVQRIPLVFTGPGVSAGAKRTEAARQADILPTVRRSLGLPHDPRLDGVALPLGP